MEQKLNQNNHIWLVLDQIYEHKASKIIPIRRVYHHLWFDLSPIIGATSNMWVFPDYEKLQILPVSSVLTMKLAYDLDQTGKVDLRLLPTRFKNFDIVPLDYPIKMPVDWKEIGDEIEHKKYEKLVDEGVLGKLILPEINKTRNRK